MKAIKGIFSPAMPELPEQDVMPLADEEMLAKSRKRMAAKRQGGRASTVLTDGSKTKLGR